jgi:hypothetical protein
VECFQTPASLPTAWISQPYSAKHTCLNEQRRGLFFLSADIVLGIRALERFGGHAKNIAGHVIFLSTAKDVRHMEADDVQQLLGLTAPGESAWCDRG